MREREARLASGPGVGASSEAIPRANTTSGYPTIRTPNPFNPSHQPIQSSLRPPASGENGCCSPRPSRLGLTLTLFTFISLPDFPPGSAGHKGFKRSNLAWTPGRQLYASR